MHILKVENHESYSLEDGSSLPQELARLRAKRVDDVVAKLGPQAITASMQGETVVRPKFVMQALGEETPTTVPERRVDNFWLHKPA